MKKLYNEGLPTWQSQWQNGRWLYQDTYEFFVSCVQGKGFESSIFDRLSSEKKSSIYRIDEFLFTINKSDEKEVRFCADKRPRRWSLSRIEVILVEGIDDSIIEICDYLSWWRDGLWWQRLTKLSEKISDIAGELAEKTALEKVQAEARKERHESALITAYYTKHRK